MPKHRIEEITVTLLSVSLFVTLTECGPIQMKTVNVTEGMCVTTVSESHWRISSAIVCASLCLNDIDCLAVTYFSKIQECQISPDEVLEDCVLTKGDATITGLIDFKKPCPAEFCDRDAQVYYEFSTTTATWDEAKLYCENDGGRLAVLETEEKRVWMREFRLTQTGTTIYSQYHWIGLWDEGGQHDWVWITGELLTDGRSNSWWNGGQPDHPNGQVDCTEMYPANHNSRWNDQGCSQQRRYICEHMF